VRIELRSGYGQFRIEGWSGERYVLLPLYYSGIEGDMDDSQRLWLKPIELFEHGSHLF
jgi:hypothetical protein